MNPAYLDISRSYISQKDSDNFYMTQMIQKFSTENIFGLVWFGFLAYQSHSPRRTVVVLSIP